MRKIIFIAAFTILSSLSLVQAQNNIVDQIVAIVGNEPVLKSDIENEFIRAQSENRISGATDYKSFILENLLMQKLLLAQAQLDSITVTETEVENQLNQRIEVFIKNIGSREKLEKYFQKPIIEIKDEFRDDIKNGMITQRMQAKITEHIRVTPSEVRHFYKNLPKDSLPEMPAEMEIQQIVVKPKITVAEKERIRKRLREFRERITKGESFATLAVLYSEDPGSAARGGELGYTTRSRLVPEFANAAFNLKPDKISKIIESEYGFHIIKLIDRKGETINVRHILIKPKIAEEERTKAMNRLDSIAKGIRDGKGNFETAAFYFSEDKDTKNNGGLIVDKQTSNSRIPLAALPPELSKQVRQLKVGEISGAFLDKTRSGEEYKIIKIKAIHKSHKANLNDDWASFEQMLIGKKSEKVMQKWIESKLITTYIHLDDRYKNSKFRYKGWVK